MILEKNMFKINCKSPILKIPFKKSYKSYKSFFSSKLKENGIFHSAWFGLQINKIVEFWRQFDRIVQSRSWRFWWFSSFDQKVVVVHRIEQVQLYRFFGKIDILGDRNRSRFRFVNLKFRLGTRRSTSSVLISEFKIFFDQNFRFLERLFDYYERFLVPIFSATISIKI